MWRGIVLTVSRYGNEKYEMWRRRSTGICLQADENEERNEDAICLIV
jgi:hypothetical protein